MSKQSPKKELIQSLNSGEASKVLLTLLKKNPDLEDKIYRIAVKILSDVNSEDIMNDVLYALDSLDVEELYGRSGKSRYGYTDPADESWVMFEEALDPFITEMEKYQKRDMQDIAKEYCIGIIKGIQEYDKGSYSEFKDWVTDAPDENIDSVLEAWKKGRPSEEDVAEVLKLIND